MSDEDSRGASSVPIAANAAVANPATRRAFPLWKDKLTEMQILGSRVAMLRGRLDPRCGRNGKEKQ